MLLQVRYHKQKRGWMHTNQEASKRKGSCTHNGNCSSISSGRVCVHIVGMAGAVAAAASAIVAVVVAATVAAEIVAAAAVATPAVTASVAP
jgi:hypothetical protein